MTLMDVNILVHAYRRESSLHQPMRSWLQDQLAASAPFGFSDLVGSGFLRIVTNAKIFEVPSPLEHAVSFLQVLRDQPNCVVIQPGPRHWSIFVDLCRKVEAKGNLVPDAYFAALAIESGSEWISADRDYARFPELHWRHPLS